jgi:hypothetical protein
MPRKIFYSFHHQNDSWRASQVRNIGVVEGNSPATDNDWEKVKRGGDQSIQNWIDGQLQGRTCTVVLIGSETASRRWVQYEIRKSWDEKMGLLGIKIHKLLDQNQKTSLAGTNPFDSFSLVDGRRLSSLARVYDPPGASGSDVYAHIKDNIANWIQLAISTRLSA